MSSVNAHSFSQVAAKPVSAITKTKCCLKDYNEAVHAAIYSKVIKGILRKYSQKGHTKFSL